MKFSALVTLASFVLADQSNRTYSTNILKQWLAEAERVIVGQVSGANPVTATIAAAAGTRQSIPADGVRLLSVDSVGGRSVRLVERAAKDEVDPYWRNEEQMPSSSEYILDERVPKGFDVSPPVQASVAIVLTYDKVPAPYDFEATPDPDIALGEVFSAAMVDYAVYRCLSRADENTPEWTKAGSHYQAFLQKITGKTKVDSIQSPKKGGFLR